MPLAAVFGPASLGGIGLKYLYVEQGSLKTLTLVTHPAQRSIGPNDAQCPPLPTLVFYSLPSLP
jgi:hypothetical protein